MFIMSILSITSILSISSMVSMTDYLRILLYYPLGLLPTIFFTLRFLIQWLQSEKAKRSIVTPLFWKLSLAGNVLQLLHYFVQIQYPFAMIQAGNAMISWRNICWMRSSKNTATRSYIVYVVLVLIAVTLGFLLQSFFIVGELDWIRTPTKFWDEARTRHSLGWHIFGTFGGILFASRFWLQWWQTEKMQRSELSKSFWWLSIIGSLISLIYFIRIGDIVNVLQYSCGAIPYFRNLMLLRDRMDKKITG
jgi:lipid-A-disaccharide synthase-like uncharacterized protein